MNKLNKLIGDIVSWLSLWMVITTCLVIVLSYALQHKLITLNINMVALQEMVVYMHATLFMLGLSYTLQHDKHVRIDIIFSKLSDRSRLIVDIIGTIVLLLPVSLFIFISSFNYVISSWAILEKSPEAGGIPAVFALKTLLLLAPALLLLQGLSLMLHKIKQL